MCKCGDVSEYSLSVISQERKSHWPFAGAANEQHIEITIVIKVGRSGANRANLVRERGAGSAIVEFLFRLILRET